LPLLLPLLLLLLLQVTGVLESCTAAALEVNSRCCPGACLNGVPTSCGSKECAETYLPFYRECGTVLQVMDEQMGTASFATLYESCVEEQGHTDAATGQLVDDSVAASQLYDFSTAGTSATSGWRVTVDGVMGGRSHGTWTNGDGDACDGALFSGTLELTHGGFVTIRGPRLAAHTLEGADGLRICSKSTVDFGVSDGVGDLYKLKLNDGSRSDWQADFNTLEAGAWPPNEQGCEGGTVSTVPFSQFWPSHWGRITGTQGSIDPADITNVGMDVSFQTADGGSNAELDHDACASGSDDCQNLNPFGLCVMWIESYTNADAAQAPAEAKPTGTGRGGQH
jgi:hypothetical protein